MILNALYELSQRVEELVKDPDYEKIPVDFLVRIDPAGRFLSLVSTQDERGRGTPREVPRMATRTSGVIARFLADNAKYVLGLTGKEDADAGRIAQCMAAFRSGVAECVAATKDEGAHAVLRFLDTYEAQRSAILAQRPREKWTGSETLVFVCDPEGIEAVYERPAVRAFWRGGRERWLVGSDLQSLRCLVTGEVGIPERLHPVIKGLASLGAQSSGAFLISFNAGAFLAHNLGHAENAPVSRRAAAGYAAALNWLLERSPERRFRSGVRVGENAVTVFWTSQQHEVTELLFSLFDPPDAFQAVRFTEAPLRGLAPGDLDVAKFYAMTVGANAARVVIRDWFTSTVADVKRHVLRYFEDLRLGEGEAVSLPLGLLLDAVAKPGDRGLPPDLGTRLFQAALRGHPFPRQLLHWALDRFRLPFKEHERRRLHACAALIKATLLRLPRSGSSPDPWRITVSLDEHQHEPAYLLGRLFAILERLQYLALGDVNASLRDRYFGAASRTPGLVFPRLLQLSIHHAAKAQADKSRQGGAIHCEKLKTEVLAALPAKTFPQLLSLERQGLFALGYYHQREPFFTRRTESAETPNAPAAAAGGPTSDLGDTP